MRQRYHLKFIFCVTTTLFLSSCCNSFEVEGFDPLVNYSQNKSDTLYTINADLSTAVLNGIEIPSIKQVAGGKFIFSFKLKNNGKPQRFFYKLYYQNDSYKWNEGDSLDHENFYGSWEEAQLEFKPTALIDDEILITDSFKIVGNPRNEKIYYGIDPAEEIKIRPERMNYFKNYIPTQPDWIESIKQKSKSNNVSIEEQTYFELLWAVQNSFQNDSSYNNRWKRNPRMGKYKFMLVVCDGQGLSQIPETVRNIHKRNETGNFTNPFTFFLKKEGKDIEGAKVLLSEKQLDVISQLNLGSGIFIDRYKTNKADLTDACYNANCGETDRLRERAQFSQYFHHINTNWEFTNVKEVRDVVGENLSREQYQGLVSDYSKSKDFVHAYANITDCACKTVSSDSVSNSITIFNPGNTTGNYKKEMTGVMSRIGYTYGKWTAKIKFPKIISENNVWNGLTTAFWLIFQADAKWNMRRSCDAEIAYIPKHIPDSPESVKESKRKVTYTEIDFEILKESRYWPQSAYGGKANYPKEDASKSNDITICCTNWDLACHQPKNFTFGAKTHDVEGHKNEFNRWDYFTKLLTAKIPAPHKEVFNDEFYYFEIDWQPQRIIWRIGKDKNNLREICRMDGTMTSIPDNQMIMVMSQEFHYQEWWPTAPFLQNFIPFPKNNLIGKLLEVEIH